MHSGREDCQLTCGLPHTPTRASGIVESCGTSPTMFIRFGNFLKFSKNQNFQQLCMLALMHAFGVAPTGTEVLLCWPYTVAARREGRAREAGALCHGPAAGVPGGPREDGPREHQLALPAHPLRRDQQPPHILRGVLLLLLPLGSGPGEDNMHTSSGRGVPSAHYWWIQAKWCMLLL